jgi:O-antigen/teichoic acid export membrane protein
MLKHIFSNWVGMVILGLISVVLTPAMVHGLGDVYFGMWALVGSLIDYSGLLDMGMRATLFRYVAYFRGANQRAALNETFATGMLIAFGATCLSFLVFLGLAVILPPFFKMYEAQAATFSWVIRLMGASISIGLPGHYLSAYLRGMERFDLYNIGIVVHGILRGTLLLILLKMGLKIIPVSLGIFLMAIFFLVFHWLLVMRADPELEMSFHHLNWQRTREMFNFGFYSFVNNSGETLRYYTDSFVIGRMLTVGLVTPFNVATRLVEYFKTLIGGVAGPVMVRLSELSGRDESEALREEFLRATRFSMLLSLFVGGLLILDGRMLIRLWVGPAYLTSYSVLVVLTVGYIVMYGQIPTPLIIFARARHHRALSWWTLVEGIANLALSILWAKRFGLLGVAMGTTVPLLVSKLIIQPWYVLRDLDMGWLHYIERGLARAVLVGGVAWGASWFLTRNISTPATLLRLTITCAWQSLLFIVVAYLLGLAPADKVAVMAQGRRFAASLGIAG